MCQLARTTRSVRNDENPLEDVVGRCREKQYQLAAQKHNEAVLKHDYYQRIAKYFERECQIAKHYDSWNYRNIDPKGELEKAKKVERLRDRRNKLRDLLKQEDEAYRKEIEERKKQIKSRSEESSLEALRQKLREKRAEQSLYLPRTCRRYQSYFVCPKESNSPGWDTLRDTNLQYSRVCRDSTNLIRGNGQNSYCRHSIDSNDNDKISLKQGNVETYRENPYSPARYSYEGERPYSKYAQRYARRSLENTNVRSVDSDDYSSNRRSSRPSLAFGPSEERYSLPKEDVSFYDKKNRMEERKLSSPQRGAIARSLSPNLADDRSKNLPREENSPLQSFGDENDYAKRLSVDRLIENVDMHKLEPAVDKHDTKEYKDARTKNTRLFEAEKTMPWLRMDPSEKDPSMRMLHFLTLRDLECKIEDLAKNEVHSCNKNFWSAALRKRNRRNRLELLREKELYNLVSLDLDEELRNLVLADIERRELELLEREKVCTDSTIYNEDAKYVWKKWLQEDETLKKLWKKWGREDVIKNAGQQREKLMDNLEKEWQNLTIQDKDRISQAYRTGMADSPLHEVLKLPWYIIAHRKNSFPSFLYD